MITITEEECKELVDLYVRAKNTPVVGLSCADMLNGKDWASQAWDCVTRYQEKLGKKYGYDYTQYGINTKTREVILVYT